MFNWKLVYANFKMVIRNKQAIYFSLVFPVITMVVLKLVLGSTTLANGLNYIDFVIPGLVTMSVMQMSIFAIAFVVAQHKEKGVIKRLFATPIRAYDYLAAQVFARVVVSVIQVLLLVAVAILIMSFVMKGSFASLIALGTLGSLVFLSLGFIVSGLSKTVETVPAIANLIIFPMILFGNIFFPIDKSPQWVKTFSEYLPIRYLVDSFRDTMIKGSSLYDVRGDLLGMLVWLVILAFIAQRVFSFGSKE